MSIDAIIGLGSNMGDRVGGLAEALRRVDACEHCDVVAVSHAYESAPWGISDQPPFANAVAVVRTTMRADDLLGALQDIENEMGRDRSVPRNGPRLIDLDILLFGDEEWDTLGLKVPHPLMAERDFAVVPLLEVRPEVHYPDGTAVTRDDVRVGRVTSLLGMIPGFETDTPPRIVSTDDDLPPKTRPLPGEEWVTVYEFGDDPTFFGFARSAATGQSPLGGGVPQIESNFIQTVLEQEGILFAWDPFPPDQSADPYGFKRRHSLKVPASIGERASRVIDEAMNAPVDWDEVLAQSPPEEPDE